jgi:hypothetical protein
MWVSKVSSLIQLLWASLGFSGLLWASLGFSGLAWAMINAPLGFARARVYHCRSCSNHLFINGAEKSRGSYSRHAPAQTVNLRHRAGAAFIFLALKYFTVRHTSYAMFHISYGV